MPDPVSFEDPFFIQLRQSGLSPEEIEKELHKKGYSPESVIEYLKQVRKKKIAKRQSNGFIYMAAGAFIGFLSCVFTISNIFPGHTGFVLYGLTSIAVLLVVLGLYFVFE